MEICKHYIEKENRCSHKDSTKYNTECCLIGGCPYYAGIDETKIIKIEVWGGCVTDVKNLPRGWSYEIVDRDITEEA